MLMGEGENLSQAPTTTTSQRPRSSPGRTSIWSMSDLMISTAWGRVVSSSNTFCSSATLRR